MITQVSPDLEAARLHMVEMLSQSLIAEVSLAQHGGGYFEPKYWDDYIASKYKWQESSNKFYVLLHEIAK